MIYLASTSPRRKKLLKKAGVRFKILKPHYEEASTVKGPPSRVVRIHAVGKAASCRGRLKNGILLAADTLVYFNGRMVGKPKSMKEACFILRKLQGKWHAVYTGVAIFKLVSGQAVKKVVFFEKTRIRLKKLTTEEIRTYFKKVNPLDKAGAYAIQSSRHKIVEEVKGDFSNAAGLPVRRVLQQRFLESIS